VLGKVLGIEITSQEDGLVEGTMPVDERTRQPYGILHGGASVVLAETLGSVGSHFIAEPEGKLAVGIEVNANHVRQVRSGLVYGKAEILHRGRTLHVWSIEIRDEQGRMVCTSRLTVMLVDRVKDEK
jgi:1,4-dihydroxy-2-naphthoyl-CoA hydrolase